MYLLIVLCFIIFTSCVNHSSTNEVVISPSSLFEGDLKRLEPHLDLLTGCVEVSYSGDKKNFKTSYEVWEKGKKIHEYESISFKGIDDLFNDSIISVSAKELENDKFRLKLIIKGAMSTKKFDLPRDHYYNAIGLNEKITIEDDEEIIIWGLAGTKVNESFVSHDSIEKTLKAANVALVLKIKFE